MGCPCHWDPGWARVGVVPLRAVRELTGSRDSLPLGQIENGVHRKRDAPVIPLKG